MLLLVVVSNILIVVVGVVAVDGIVVVVVHQVFNGRRCLDVKGVMRKLHILDMAATVGNLKKIYEKCGSIFLITVGI